MSKSRKPLDDALAKEFVYGEHTSSRPTQPEPTSLPISQPESNLMAKLLDGEPKEATIRLTVDLPESMHRKLSLLSARTGKKKAAIVRLLLTEALEEVQE
uniref:CopG domain protein DNA-binding domain protein n=1 Tax=Cyanothece sp. (strain PCC 7425 / ATCC 29141) TaxID=395961 RepID=B8HZQ5_CYAP4